jgi:hypothetical protein
MGSLVIPEVIAQLKMRVEPKADDGGLLYHNLLEDEESAQHLGLVPKKRVRLGAIDLLRGCIMIIMCWDHSKDAIAKHEVNPRARCPIK